MPPPTPVPRVNIAMFSLPRPAPNLYSPQIAAFASFSTTTSTPISAVNFSSIARPFHPSIFGVPTTVLLSDEMNPGTEIPIECISCDCINSLATSAITLTAAMPPSGAVSFRAVARISPDGVTTPPKTFVPPTSIPIVSFMEAIFLHIL